jgi:hypothetical protein
VEGHAFPNHMSHAMLAFNGAREPHKVCTILVGRERSTQHVHNLQHITDQTIVRL